MSTSSKTRAQQAYEALRRQIFSGRWDADRRHTIRGIAREMGFSVVPVSEAVRRLEQQGLLETRPRSGVRLRQLSEEEAREMQILRRAVELHALDRIFQKGPEEALISRLGRLAEGLQPALESGKLHRAIWLDCELHRTLVRASRSRRLLETFETITLCLVHSRMWGSIRSWREMEEDQARGHAAFIEHIRSGHADAARRYLLEHF
jgi:DNA-binding GntR family transcriptional regulator